jgi:hypothetical protein
MKARNLIVGGLASVALVTALAGTTHAAPTAAPFITGVSLKLISPSTLTKAGSLSGSFDVNIVETGTNSNDNYFYLYRDTASRGDENLGYLTGQSNVDLVLDSFGATNYEIVACEYSGYCQTDGGGPHGGVVSSTFSPATLDNPFSGTGTVVSSVKHYYDGTALQTTGSGATVTWTASDAYNVAVVVGTGPKGGIGQVYVNGKKVNGPAGQINFYSAAAGGCEILFKTGTANPQVNTIKIVSISAGAKGGFDMWLDAGVELLS